MSKPDPTPFAGAKLRGRPRKAEPHSSGLYLKLTDRQYDLLAQFSLRHGIPMAELVRRKLFVDFSSLLP